MLFIAEPRLRPQKILLIQLLDTQLSSPSPDIFPASDICHRLPYLYEIPYFSFFTGVSTGSICLLWHFTSPCCRKWQNSTPFYGWLIFLCVCTPHLLYSFISGDLGWLHILALMNSSAVNNRCQVSLQQTDVHSFVNVQLGNCCIIESCYQVLKEPAILVSLMTHQFTLPSTVYPHQHLCLSFKKGVIQTGVRWFLFALVFICFSPNDFWYLAFFIYFLYICILSNLCITGSFLCVCLFEDFATHSCPAWNSLWSADWSCSRGNYAFWVPGSQVCTTKSSYCSF